MTEREAKILKLIEQHRYLTTGMIQSALFCFPSGKDKAWQVLRKMHRRGLINRFREGEYIYHTGAKSKKWRHWLDLARFHFALLSELKSWQRIIFWQPEVKYPYGIADGLYILRLTLDGAGVMFFLEYDDGNNPFQKVQQYMAYYQGKSWRGEWWGSNFPLVLIVTPRAGEIRLMIERSKAGIFRVLSEPKNIIREVTRRDGIAADRDVKEGDGEERAAGDRLIARRHG